MSSVYSVVKVTPRFTRTQHGLNPSTNDAGWSDKAVECLKRHWADGLSCSQIASMLAKECKLSKSRSSVIGKAHRLGLSRGRPSHPPSRLAERRPQPKVTSHQSWGRYALEHKPPPLPKIIDSPIETSALINLEDHMCTWPVEGEGGTHFCGAPKVRGAFCAKHANAAYVGRSRRRRSIHAGDEDKLRSYLAAQAQWG